MYKIVLFLLILLYYGCGHGTDCLPDSGYEPLENEIEILYKDNNSSKYYTKIYYVSMNKTDYIYRTYSNPRQYFFKLPYIKSPQQFVLISPDASDTIKLVYTLELRHAKCGDKYFMAIKSFALEATSNPSITFTLRAHANPALIITP